VQLELACCSKKRFTRSVLCQDKLSRTICTSRSAGCVVTTSSRNADRLLAGGPRGGLADDSAGLRIQSRIE
jgi:hypothetical protein